MSRHAEGGAVVVVCSFCRDRLRVPVPADLEDVVEAAGWIRRSDEADVCRACQGKLAGVKVTPAKRLATKGERHVTT